MLQVAVQSGALPVGSPRLSLGSMDPFNTTSFALSILLVFRTQASYDR
jgi:predicted membrane chloride channel (bestrophin family)